MTADVFVSERPAVTGRGVTSERTDSGNTGVTANLPPGVYVTAYYVRRHRFTFYCACGREAHFSWSSGARCDETGALLCWQCAMSSPKPLALCRRCRTPKPWPLAHGHPESTCRECRQAGRSRPAPRECAACGSTFTPSRADARYCSPACRQRAYRARRSGGAA